MNYKRNLILVVAYNAEKTIGSVIDRINKTLCNSDADILVLDDCSQDKTVEIAEKKSLELLNSNIIVLRNPVNQGYGGNQKIGYQYAIERGYQNVAMVHGDGQYAPEELLRLLEPLLNREAEVVFGSRMISKKSALAGGMPIYKWIGNQVLSNIQNVLLGSNLSEFHSGYRLYSVEALKKIPFERNSNDFHFDTDIIIQVLLAKCRIVELSIPTFYGDEKCYVNGFKYARDVLLSTFKSKLHSWNLFYDRKYDIGQIEFNYDLKLGFISSHSMAIECARPGSNILDIGCGQGLVAKELFKKGAHVVGVDQYAGNSGDSQIRVLQSDLDNGLPEIDISHFDQIYMLDIIEHLKDPEAFMENLRQTSRGKRPELVITTANVAFIIIRLMLLLGSFNYGKKGILDRTHTRLFTFDSLLRLLTESGYSITECRGIPPPYPKAIGLNILSKALLWINTILIGIFPKLFSYQIFVKAKFNPTVDILLNEALNSKINLSGKNNK